jgi:uncharacterized protein (TIGR02466 family)
MPQISTRFAVPIATEVYPLAQNLNPRLVKLFLASEGQENIKNPSPYTVRNQETFESKFDLFYWDSPEIAELREFCISSLMKVVAELNRYDVETLKKIKVIPESWFHITRRNGFFGVHNHPMASWSGVYCVSSGNHDADQPESGRLVFLHPNMAGNMFLDAGTAKLQSPFSFSNIAFSLEGGQLILFPSHLSHHVQPFFGEGERITVAFNCAFQML